MSFHVSDSEVFSDEWASLLLSIPSLDLMLQRDFLLRLHAVIYMQFSEQRTEEYNVCTAWMCVCVCVCVLTEQNSIDLWPEQKTNVYTENCILCSVIKQKGNKWNAFHTCFCITNMLIPGWFTEAGCDPNNLLILSTASDILLMHE